MTTTPQTRTAHQCPDCNTIYIEDDLVPIYECSRCGGTSTERRCEECNIFMARSGTGCEDCAVECDEVEYVEDHDGAMILAEDWDPQESKASRDAADAEKQAAAHAEAKQKAREALAATAQEVPATALAVGDHIMHPEPSPHDPDATVQVQSLIDWGDTLGVVVSEFGMAQVFPVPRDHLFTRVPAPSRSRTRSREDGGAFGEVTFTPDGGAMSMSSAPRPGTESFIVETSHMARNGAPWGDVPCVTLLRRTQGLLSVMAVFINRAQAESALAVWEQAGRALAVARDVEPVVDRKRVEQEFSDWAMHTDFLGRPVRFELGTNEWDRDNSIPFLNVRLPGSNVTLGDPGLILGVVAATRELLGHLDHPGGRA